jgi:hypothetical protein
MISLMIGGASIALLIFALVDVIRSDSYTFKYLDKLTWIFIVVLLPLVGSILWFAIGRVYSPSPAATQYDGPPGPPRAAARPLAPTEEEEQAAIENEIAFHENEARIRRLEAELKARRAKGEEA